MLPYAQVKILKDVKKGKVSVQKHSRGVAFVDFEEHEHALVALRVLNNNPGKIGCHLNMALKVVVLKRK